METCHYKMKEGCFASSKCLGSLKSRQMSCRFLSFLFISTVFYYRNRFLLLLRTFLSFIFIHSFTSTEYVFAQYILHLDFIKFYLNCSTLTKRSFFIIIFLLFFFVYSLIFVLLLFIYGKRKQLFASFKYFKVFLFSL